MWLCIAIIRILLSMEEKIKHKLVSRKCSCNSTKQKADYAFEKCKANHEKNPECYEHFITWKWNLPFLCLTYTYIKLTFSILSLIHHVKSLTSEEICVLLSAEDIFKLWLNYILDLCPKSKKCFKFACHHESVKLQTLWV